MQHAGCTTTCAHVKNKTSADKLFLGRQTIEHMGTNAQTCMSRNAVNTGACMHASTTMSNKAPRSRHRRSVLRTAKQTTSASEQASGSFGSTELADSYTSKLAMPFVRMQIARYSSDWSSTELTADVWLAILGISELDIHFCRGLAPRLPQRNARLRRSIPLTAAKTVA